MLIKSCPFDVSATRPNVPFRPDLDPFYTRSAQVSVFKHLEVNVFPSVKYHLDINIRRYEAAALQQYFKLEVSFCGSSLPLNRHNEAPWQARNTKRFKIQVFLYSAGPACSLTSTCGTPFWSPRSPPSVLSGAFVFGLVFYFLKPSTLHAGFQRQTKQAEADEPRSKGRRLLPSRKNSPKAASNTSSARGGGERGDAPPDSPGTARDAPGDGADVGVPSLLENQGSEEGRALLLGRRAPGSATPNPAGGMTATAAAAAAAAAGLEAGNKVCTFVSLAVLDVVVVACVAEDENFGLIVGRVSLDLQQPGRLKLIPQNGQHGASSQCPLPASLALSFVLGFRKPQRSRDRGGYLGQGCVKVPVAPSKA